MWSQILPLPLASYVRLEKLLDVPAPEFPQYKM